MEFMTDDQDIEDSLAALDRIKDWAYEQMGSMRRPKPMSEQPAEGEVDEMNAGMEEEMPPAEAEMEMPMGDMPPPSFGDSGKPAQAEMEVIKPGRMSQSPSSQPVPPKDDGMKKWTNDTVNKLDKFGKKLPRR